jgi:hypothetical protein
MLPQKYVMLGFELSELGDKSLILKFKNKVIFVFGGGINIREDLVGKLCESHLKSFQL